MSDIVVKRELIPTHFGEAVDINLPPNTIMLVSVLTPVGLQPVKVLLPHQLYKKDIEELEKRGDVVITHVPYAMKHVNISKLLK